MSTSALEALPHAGASSFASHAALAASSDAGDSAASLDFDTCEAMATSVTAAATAPQVGASRRSSQARFASSSDESCSHASSTCCAHCSASSEVATALDATCATAAAAWPHCGASSFAIHACFAETSVVFSFAACTRAAVSATAALYCAHISLIPLTFRPLPFCDVRNSPQDMASILG